MKFLVEWMFSGVGEGEARLGGGIGVCFYIFKASGV